MIAARTPEIDYVSAKILPFPDDHWIRRKLCLSNRETTNLFGDAVYSANQLKHWGDWFDKEMAQLLRIIYRP